MNNRILKIVKLDFPFITFISNNGEYRTVDIKRLFEERNIRNGDFGYEIVQDPAVFNAVELVDKALAWKQVSTCIQISDKENMPAFFHLDPLVTIQHSVIDKNHDTAINMH